jgi:hypothetical protein
VPLSNCPNGWPFLSIHPENGLLLPSIHPEIGLLLPSIHPGIGLSFPSLPSIHRKTGLELPFAHLEAGLHLPVTHREIGLLSKDNSHATLGKAIPHTSEDKHPSMNADDDTDYIRTPTAAMLIGKSIRTVHNWLESGIITGKKIPYPGIPAGFAQKINLLSMQSFIPFAMTNEITKSIYKVDKSNDCNSEEIVKIGLLFYGVKHYKIAVDWFSYSAKQGNHEAMFLLSECFFKGLGVEKSHATSLQWLGKSSEKGNMRATAKINQISNFLNTLEE